MIEKVKLSEYYRTAVFAEGWEALRYKKDKCKLLDSYNCWDDFEKDLLFAVKSPVDGQYYLATPNTFYLDDYGYEYEGVKILILELEGGYRSDYDELFPDRRFEDEFITIQDTPKIFMIYKKEDK